MIEENSDLDKTVEIKKKKKFLYTKSKLDRLIKTTITKHISLFLLKHRNGEICWRLIQKKGM